MDVIELFKLHTTPEIKVRVDYSDRHLEPYDVQEIEYNGYTLSYSVDYISYDVWYVPSSYVNPDESDYKVDSIEVCDFCMYDQEGEEVELSDEDIDKLKSWIESDYYTYEV